MASGEKKQLKKKKHPSSRLHYSKWKSLKIHFLNRQVSFVGLTFAEICKKEEPGSRKNPNAALGSWSEAGSLIQGNSVQLKYPVHPKDNEGTQVRQQQRRNEGRRNRKNHKETTRRRRTMKLHAT